MRKNILVIFLCISSLPAVALFWDSAVLLQTYLIVISVVILGLKNNRHDILIYLTSAFGGAAAEVYAIYNGAWSYSIPHFLGIPFWLPTLWGIAGIFISTKASMLKDGKYLHELI